MRRSRVVLLAAGGVALLAAAGAVSAALGEPSEEVRVEQDVPAARAAVWHAVADLAAYGRWNPLFVRADGALRKGGTIRLTVAGADGGTSSRKVQVFALISDEKIRWQDRMLGVRGLRDREFTIRLEPRGPRVTHVSVTERLEGPLVPFAGDATSRERLAAMVTALGREAAPAS
jgi:hypothetical protein